MIAYDRYTELLGKIIHKTITPAEQKDVEEFEAAHRITEAANLVLQKEIARHRQTEAVLALSEARFSQIVASIEDVIYSVDSENREFNYVSPVFKRMLGYTLDDVARLGGRERFLAEVIQDGRFEEQQALFRQLQKGPTDIVPRWQAWWRCKDGRLKFIEDFSLPVYFEGGLQRTYGVLRDITGRKQAETAMQESAAQYRSLFDHMLNGFAYCRILYEQDQPQDFIYIAVNDAFGKLTGLKNVVGRKVSEVIPGIRKLDPELFEIYGRVARTGAPERLERYVESMQMWFDIAVYSPRPDHFVAVFDMITERKQAEERLRQSQKREAIGHLAGGVAHDFNNILAAVLLETELLAMDQTVSPEVRDGLSQIRQLSDRAAGLVRQLLLFSRRQIMQPQDLDLNEVVAGLAGKLKRIIPADVKTHLHLCPDPLLIHADPVMMDQVWENIVANARDAMPGSGQLTIETAAVEFDEFAVAQSAQARPGAFACLSITDTGTGIPPEILPRIFDPFFTTKEVGKGSGLGLSAALGVVQEHQGWISVHSKVGRGTAVKIYLPRLAGLTDMKIPKKVEPAASAGRETILLVEDEPSLRGILKTTLAKLGYHVLVAANGVKALEVWREHRAEIHLLLTDMVMPGGLSGWDLAQRLLPDDPQLKVVYMSGYSLEALGRDFKLQAGVNFLAKPFQTRQLAQIIRDQLDQPA